MHKYAHDAIVPDNESQATKKEQVANMFNQIAHKYDYVNRFMSGGTDVGWRKKAINELADKKPQTILDVATGTGDVAILCNEILQPKKIVGIDISNGMLDLGKEKIKQLNLSNIIELTYGDSENLQFENNSFDAITIAFGVRNFQNLEKGLGELFRVLKPNGKIVILEATKPTNPIINFFCSIYTKKIVPFFGGIFSGNKKAYLYLNNSIKAFPERQNFLNILIAAGFTQTYYKSLSLGVCTIYCASK